MVMYKGVLLAKNSDAYKLWLEKEFKKLDEHMELLTLILSFCRNNYLNLRHW